MVLVKHMAAELMELIVGQMVVVRMASKVAMELTVELLAVELGVELSVCLLRLVGR